MINAIKNKTRNTPNILHDLSSNFILFEGDCTPEDAVEFFDSFIPDLVQLNKTNNIKKLVFELNYYNSSSSKCLLDFFITLSKTPTIKNNITIEWKHDKDDYELKEAGENFKGITNLNYVFIEY